MWGRGQTRTNNCLLKNLPLPQQLFTKPSAKVLSKKLNSRTARTNIAMRTPKHFLLAILFATAAPLAIAQTSATAATAATPAVKKNWLGTHEKFCARAAKGNIDILFVGDSITSGWTAGNGKGITVWNANFASLNAANFGIASDRTENVLWRMQNGELENISPKVCVLMVGTNNMAHNAVPEIAEGIAAIVKTIREKCPRTKILLLGIFPRSKNPNHEFRLKIVRTNALISKLNDNEHIHYLDIGQKFLRPDGTMPRDIMPDYLHPNTKGYQIWADAILPKLKELLE